MMNLEVRGLKPLRYSLGHPKSIRISLKIHKNPKSLNKRSSQIRISNDKPQTMHVSATDVLNHLVPYLFRKYVT